MSPAPGVASTGAAAGRPIQRAPIRAARLPWLSDIARILQYAGLREVEIGRALGGLIAGEAPGMAPADVHELAADVWRISQAPSPDWAVCESLEDSEPEVGDCQARKRSGVAGGQAESLPGGWESFAA